MMTPLGAVLSEFTALLSLGRAWRNIAGVSSICY